jgi:S1-C subfamily serine protease
MADGKVLTAAHVVQFASRIDIEFANGVRTPARVVSAAPLADLALLQATSVPPDIHPASLGDSNALQVGDQVFAIGTPHGLPHSLSVGWVSARRSGQAFENLTALELLQIDMAVYEGNSGGPVFNLTGEVVGIVSHALLQVGTGTGPGFAVASNVARRLMLESGKVWLGVETYLIDGPLARLFNVPQSAGLLVQSVATDSLAARLGLRDGQFRIAVEGQPLIAGGDVVLEMLGHRVEASRDSLQIIEAALAALRPGDPVTMKALRGGQVVELVSRIAP